MSANHVQLTLSQWLHAVVMTSGCRGSLHFGFLWVLFSLCGFASRFDVIRRKGCASLGLPAEHGTHTRTQHSHVYVHTHTHIARIYSFLFFCLASVGVFSSKSEETFFSLALRNSTTLVLCYFPWDSLMRLMCWMNPLVCRVTEIKWVFTSKDRERAKMSSKHSLLDTRG